MSNARPITPDELQIASEKAGYMCSALRLLATASGATPEHEDTARLLAEYMDRLATDLCDLHDRHAAVAQEGDS